VFDAVNRYDRGHVDASGSAGRFLWQAQKVARANSGCSAGETLQFAHGAVPFAIGSAVCSFSRGLKVHDGEDAIASTRRALYPDNPARTGTLCSAFQLAPARPGAFDGALERFPDAITEHGAVDQSHRQNAPGPPDPFAFQIQASVARVTSIARNVTMNGRTNSLPGQLGRG
jgi:hypothetical protein